MPYPLIVCGGPLGRGLVCPCPLCPPVFLPCFRVVSFRCLGVGVSRLPVCRLFCGPLLFCFCSRGVVRRSWAVGPFSFSFLCSASVCFNRSRLGMLYGTERSTGLVPKYVWGLPCLPFACRVHSRSRGRLSGWVVFLPPPDVPVTRLLSDTNTQAIDNAVI